MRRTVLIVVGVMVIALVFGVFLTRRLISTWHPEGAPGSVRALTSGRGVTIELSDRPVPLPELSLRDLNGQPITAAAWRGKVVLINFWATWCGPCRDEIPDLVALQRQYADQLVIVGLSIDTDAPDAVRAFAESHGVNYPVAVVGDEVVRAFGGVPAVPATFVVDRTGQIVQRHLGRIDESHTEHEIRALAGLPTAARVVRVPDTGQVLLANAAYATEIPGVDLASLTPALKQRALTQMNTEHCSCGCGLTLAQCRIQDPTCDVSLPQARKVVASLGAVSGAVSRP